MVHVEYSVVNVDSLKNMSLRAPLTAIHEIHGLHAVRLSSRLSRYCDGFEKMHWQQWTQWLQWHWGVQACRKYSTGASILFHWIEDWYGLDFDPHCYEAEIIMLVSYLLIAYSINGLVHEVFENCLKVRFMTVCEHWWFLQTIPCLWFDWFCPQLISTTFTGYFMHLKDGATQGGDLWQP